MGYFVSLIIIRTLMSLTASIYKKIGVSIITFGLIAGYVFGFMLAMVAMLVGTGLLVSAFLVESSGDLVRHAQKMALDEWNGNYYMWGNCQIRIFDTDDCAWVVDEDLIGAAGMKLDKKLRRQLVISYSGYRIIPGTSFYGFNENAVLKFLSGKQERNPEIIKLLLWFQRDVFPPLRNRRGRSAR